MKFIYTKKTVTGLVFFTLTLLLYHAALFPSVSPAAGTKVVDRIIAVVNDDIITLFDLNKKFAPYTKNINTLGYPLEKERKLLFKVREDLIDQLIDEKLTDQEIKKLKVVISEQEIDNTIERIKEANFQTDEELRNLLAREGLTLEEYRNRMKEQLLRIKLVNRAVKSKIIITKNDVKTYYEQHPGEYGGEEKYHLKNILLKLPSISDDEEKRLIRKKMESVVEKLNKGMSFEEAADSFSESAIPDSGGELGVFSLDALSPRIRTAIKGIKPGGYTSIIETDPGYQIFFLKEIIKTPGKPLDKVSSEIEEKLFQKIVDEKFKAWLGQLRKQSHIKIIK